MKNTIAALLIFVLCVLAPRAVAEPQIVIKFSHVVAPEAPKGKAAEFFAARVAELTRGAVKVEVYANSILYEDKEEMEALQLGAVQMLAPSMAKLAPLGLTEFEVFDLPYIFDNTELLHKVTQGPIGRSLLAKLEPKGIKGLAFWDNGLKSFSANRPLKTLADFHNLKLRIQSSKVLEVQTRALGALPQVMAFSDVYQALKTGVVDGTENPHSNFYTQRMHEVQQHMTLTGHGYLGYVVIVNRRFWNSLPSGIRSRLEQAMREATVYANRIAQEENDDALAKIRGSGMTQIHTPTPDERAALKRAMLKAHRDMAPRIGRKIIDAIYRETGFTPPEPKLELQISLPSRRDEIILAKRISAGIARRPLARHPSSAPAGAPSPARGEGKTSSLCSENLFAISRAGRIGPSSYTQVGTGPFLND